ncbi:hypothetical protein HBB16_04585 [Pseudonocardia sp. MCCB 268]|nr:hypothetical protein [Pseudonocardia cytotoxica]
MLGAEIVYVMGSHDERSAFHARLCSAVGALDRRSHDTVHDIPRPAAGRVSYDRPRPPPRQRSTRLTPAPTAR